MRLKSLFLLDLRFQAKYGFYFLYAVLTVIYNALLFAVPESWKERTAVILIFSDPASMGLFFMGAIVLLEKNQHTPYAFAVSPVRPTEYIIAKVGSLAAVSLVVAAILALSAGGTHLPVILLGTLLSSTIFTLLGIIVATKINSLNQYLLWTVPLEAVCFVPTILSPYYALIDLCFAMLSPAMFCFVAAMVALEEADERTAAYLFITPLGKNGYLAARLLVPSAAAFLATLVLLPLFRLTTSPRLPSFGFRQAGHCRASSSHC